MKIVNIVKNYQKLSQIFENCQKLSSIFENCPKLWKFSKLPTKKIKIGKKMSKLSTKIICQVMSLHHPDQMSQGHKCLGSLFVCKNQKVTQRVSQWVTRSPIELFWTAKKVVRPWPSWSHWPPWLPWPCWVADHPDQKECSKLWFQGSFALLFSDISTSYLSIRLLINWWLLFHSFVDLCLFLLLDFHEKKCCSIFTLQWFGALLQVRPTLPHWTLEVVVVLTKASDSDTPPLPIYLFTST